VTDDGADRHVRIATLCNKLLSAKCALDHGLSYVCKHWQSGRAYNRTRTRNYSHHFLKGRYTYSSTSLSPVNNLHVHQSVRGLHDCPSRTRRPIASVFSTVTVPITNRMCRRKQRHYYIILPLSSIPRATGLTTLVEGNPHRESM
jgi:hypothetical protein